MKNFLKSFSRVCKITSFLFFRQRDYAPKNFCRGKFFTQKIFTDGKIKKIFYLVKMILKGIKKGLFFWSWVCIGGIMKTVKMGFIWLCACICLCLCICICICMCLCICICICVCICICINRKMKNEN